MLLNVNYIQYKPIKRVVISITMILLLTIMRIYYIRYIYFIDDSRSGVITLAISLLLWSITTITSA